MRYTRGMSRSVSSLSALGSLVFVGLFLCLTACNAAPTRAKSAASSQAQVQVRVADVDSQPPAAEPQLPETPAPAAAACAAACGSDDTAHSACGQGEPSCGCGQHTGSGSHAACGGGAPDRTARLAEHAGMTLTRVDDPSQICMVRNHDMGRPQLAVEADGSTYYGCCAGCANRLLRDPQARRAVDPVTHNAIDKAQAVLAKTQRGDVLYFENEASLEMFRAALR